MISDKTGAFPYSQPAIWLHWASVLAIGVALATGLYLSELAMSLQKLKLMNWHKWVGVAALAIAVLRSLWRLKRKPPPWPTSMSLLQRNAAGFAHLSLYLLMLSVPLLGWAYSSSAGFPVVWLGVIPLPDWVPRDRQLAETLKLVHQVSAYLLLLLIVLHVAAVLKHQIIDKDRLIDRMHPWR